MIFVTKEGDELKSCINFYPWTERNTSFGFRLKNGFWLRYAHHVRVLYVGRLRFEFAKFKST